MNEEQRLPPAASAIRRQLSLILGSTEFDASERNRRFLAYIVEETLADRSDRIKAYTVATDVFGRDESFNPQIDPIVRIEASRLRRSLEHFYLTAGNADPVLISIPKGSYVPAFEVRSPPPSSDDASEKTASDNGRPGLLRQLSSDRALPAGRLAIGSMLVGALILFGLAFAGVALFQPASVLEPGPKNGSLLASGTRPGIFVTPFVEEGDQSAFPNFARGLVRELVVGLARFDDIYVFAADTTFKYGDGAHPVQTAAGLGAQFVLSGSSTLVNDKFTVTVLLTDVRTGRQLWAARFDGDLAAKTIFDTRDKIASQVVRVLARPNGVITAEEAKASAGKAPELLTSYECVVRYYIYWKEYPRDAYQPIRNCLERVVASDPDYADAHAALAMIYIDGFRLGFDDANAGEKALRRARTQAQRAIDLAPGSTRGYHALALVYWLQHEVELSLETARQGLALNPNDTELMAELGMRYALRNEWERALPLLTNAISQNPAESSLYRLPLAVYDYINGRYKEALAEAQKINLPDVIYGHIITAMTCAKLGMKSETEAAVRRILEIDPSYGARVADDLAMRNIHPELISVVVDGLRDAGLPMPVPTAGNVQPD